MNDVEVKEQTTENNQAPVGTTPLRTDAEGNSLYPEWSEDDILPNAPEEGDEEEQWPQQTSTEVLAEVEDNWDAFRRKVVTSHLNADSLLDGVEKVYSTSGAAAFFGRSNQWMYWGLRNDIFTFKDGTPIRPERIGKGGRRRFTLPLIREIGLSCYRRGNLTEEELQDVMAKILIAEFGENAFA